MDFTSNIEIIRNNLSILAALFTIANVVRMFICNRRIRLNFLIETRNILNENSISDKLPISYDGKSITSLSMSYISLWSNRNHKILADDYDMECPPQIEVISDNVILSYEIIKFNNNFNFANAQAKRIDNSHISIDFKKITYRDGILLKVIHTGNKNDIRFCPNLCSDITLSSKIKFSKKFRIILTIYCFILLILTPLFLWSTVKCFLDSLVLKAISYAFLMVCCLIILILCIFLLHKNNDIPRAISSYIKSQIRKSQ